MPAHISPPPHTRRTRGKACGARSTKRVPGAWLGNALGLTPRATCNATRTHAGRGACVRRPGKGLGVEPRVVHGEGPARSAGIEVHRNIQSHKRTLLHTRPALSAAINVHTHIQCHVQTYVHATTPAHTCTPTHAQGCCARVRDRAVRGAYGHRAGRG
eukprot:scaffold915_cov327-Prasinococcus_capsulatus_cf.AAC.3